MIHLAAAAVAAALYQLQRRPGFHLREVEQRQWNERKKKKRKIILPPPFSCQLVLEPGWQCVEEQVVSGESR